MNKEELEKLNKELIVGFNKDMGMVVTKYDKKGECEIEIELRDIHKNPMQTVHGGVIFSLADTVGGFAIFALRDAPCTTVMSAIDYINPTVGAKKLIGRAKVVKYGKRMSTVEVTIFTEKKVEVAKVITTYYNLTKEYKAV